MIQIKLYYHKRAGNLTKYFSKVSDHINLLLGGTSKVISTAANVQYPSDATPLTKILSGDTLQITGGVISITDSIFTTNNGYTHLILQIEPPSSSVKPDLVLGNNYASLPVTVHNNAIGELITSMFNQFKINYSAAIKSIICLVMIGSIYMCNASLIHV